MVKLTWDRDGLPWEQELDAHNEAGSGVHGMPDFSGSDLAKGLLWNGAGWEKAGLVTPTQLSAVRQLPAGAVRANMGRHEAGSAAVAAMTSGTMGLFSIYLFKDDVVKNITAVAGTTKLAEGTHQWAALFNPALEKVGISADKTNEAWEANNAKTFALEAEYKATESGLYYVGLLVAAGTPNNFSGSGAVQGVSGLTNKTAAVSTSTGLTTPAGCPAKAVVSGSRNGAPYIFVS